MKPLVKSSYLFAHGQEVMPGGVNSPVRAFKSVGLDPRFIARATGSRFWDVDGNEYLDFVCSWGPMILGHAHPAVINAVIESSKNGLSFGAPNEKEVELAEFMVDSVPSLEMVRMVNSGTEAVMSALRVARGFTRRPKILKFAGCYHGHSDALLVKAGSGALTAGQPDSDGVPAEFVQHTLVGTYNDVDSTRDLIKAHAEELAAVIVEPVAANMGVVPPAPGFLQELRTLCDEHGILLIFDEVITGFRLGLEGAQGLYGVRPDLTIYGKIIGGGMPVGAYGGRRDVMSCVAPLGSVYQAGTLSGNPVAMAAGLATLKQLRTTLNFYDKLEAKAERLEKGLLEVVAEEKAPVTVQRVGSLLTLFFQPAGQVSSYEQVLQSNRESFAHFFRYMLDKGIYLPPSQFEAWFVSASHGDGEIDKVVDAVRNYFSQSSSSSAEIQDD